VVRKFEFDWVVVRVDFARRIVAIGLVALIAVGLLFLGHRLLNQPPRVVARKAIERAEQVRERCRNEAVPAAWKNELVQADAQLKEAREAYVAEQWEAARKEADLARQRYELLLGEGDRTLAGVGQIVSLEGDVAVQRAGRSEWQPAHERQPLFNGDFVRTGNNGLAEILFSNGTLYRLDPNSLLEVSRPHRTASSASVSMVVGEIDVSTADQPAHVSTEAARAVIGRESRVRVGVRADDKTAVIAAFEGGARVRSASGPGVHLGPREVVEASPGQGLSGKQRIPDPPVLLEPPVNAAFELGKDRVITLRWRLPEGAVASHLQVSRSRLFLPSTLDVDSQGRKKSSARLRPMHRGIYFWRVAAVNREGMESEWSEPWRFRVVGASTPAGLMDVVPPKLELKPLQQLGHLFIIEGTTEPGAEVEVNGEMLDVEGDGHFRKTIEVIEPGWNTLVIVARDPAGNETTRQERVFVEVY